MRPVLLSDRSVLTGKRQRHRDSFGNRGRGVAQFLEPVAENLIRLALGLKRLAAHWAGDQVCHGTCREAQPAAGAGSMGHDHSVSDGWVRFLTARVVLTRACVFMAGSFRAGQIRIAGMRDPSQGCPASHQSARSTRGGARHLRRGVLARTHSDTRRLTQRLVRPRAHCVLRWPLPTASLPL